MPHKVYNLLTQSVAADLEPVQLIPGVEPGGARVGQPTKPGLLVKDCWVQVINGSMHGAADLNMGTWFLKLSQEPDLNPGLLLPIGQLGTQRTQTSAVGEFVSDILVKDLFHAQGTIWAPAYVGVRFEVAGSPDISANIHLDYEMVDIEWMDWFIMWDFLDNVADNSLEY